MKAMKKKEYIAPETEMKTVELERGFMVASGKETTIDKDEVEIEVKEYASIENDVTFN